MNEAALELAMKALIRAMEYVPTEADKAATKAANDQVIAGLKVKANAIARESIGSELSVRTSKTSVVKGVIVSAEFHRVECTTRQAKAIFRVVMECGSAKAHREFFVSKLPR